MGAEGARRERMQRILVGLLAASLSLLGLPLRAENRTAPKGPDEDGTKPALVRIAGEGLLNSHAFGFLTELSDDIGGRVTGTPADRQAEEWGVAKMKSLGLENVHTEQYTIWRGWTRGTAEGEILAPVQESRLRRCRASSHARWCIAQCAHFPGRGISFSPRPILPLGGPPECLSRGRRCRHSIPLGSRRRAN